jgi:cytochrome c biogenesis factor
LLVYTKKILLFLVPIVIALLAHELTTYDYWYYVLYLRYINFELTNPLLLNSINKFHPLLLYLSLLWVTIYSFQNTQTQTITYCKYSYKEMYVNTSLFVLILTMFLGSWWAIQEGSWGGWWNWDPSEVFGLLLIVNYLLLIHSKKNLRVKKRYALFLIMLSLGTLLSYLLIQLNFDLVSHNFGTRTSAFTNLAEFFLLTCWFLVLLFSCKFKAKMKSVLATKRFTFKLTIYNISILIISFIFYFSSFKLLFSDPLWQLITFKSTNYLFKLQWVIIYTLLISICYLWSVSFELTILFGILLFYWELHTTSVISFIIMTISNLNIYIVVHLLIIMFLYLNIETYEKSTLLFSANLPKGNFHFSVNSTNTYITRNSIENFTINENSIYPSLNGSVESQWFSKLLSQNNLEQVLKIGSNNLNFSIKIFESGHVNLVSILVTSLFAYALGKNTKKRITL